MTEFEYSGLADKIASALSFQRHAEGLPKSKVAFDRHELAYLHACISFYVSEQMLRLATPEYERKFQGAITDLVMRHIDRMNDVCGEDPAVAIINSFASQFDPIFDAYLDEKFPGRPKPRADGLPPIPDTLPCETE